jgi:apolipoprotein D and lipocalin family protein
MRSFAVFLTFLVGLLSGCAATNQPIETVERVDMQRFMGDWFVIAAIPTFIEKNAYNAIESYRMAPDGTVATTFTFRDGGFDGPLRRYTPTGYVLDDTGAVWGMQFIWPIRAEYRVAHLDAAYRETIIGRTARDYVWVMSRSPSVSEADYQRLAEKVKQLGYDRNRLRRVPQRWP